MIKGHCECAAVQYEVQGELVDYCHCHCSICRRLHGAPFVTWGGVARGEFSYTSGENVLKTYAFSKNADSIFCGICGSRMLVDYKPILHELPELSVDFTSAAWLIACRTIADSYGSSGISRDVP